MGNDLSDDVRKRILRDVEPIAADGAECCDVVACEPYQKIADRFAEIGRPLPPHSKEKCSECGIDVIVSPLSPPSPKRLCMTCAEPYLLAEGAIITTSERMMPVIEFLRRLEEKDPG